MRRLSRVSVKRNGVLGVNLVVALDETYPTASTTRSMAALAKRHTVPALDTCAMTRFGVTLAAGGLRLEVGGRLPHGNAVTKESTLGWMPVTLRATALALVGMPATPTTGNSTTCPAANRVGVPTPTLLSISRTGEMGMYRPDADAE